MATAPPLPFHHHPSIERKIFKELKASEREKDVAALQPLCEWCQYALPSLTGLPIATVQDLTDREIAELTAFYHEATGIQGSASTRDSKLLGKALESLPPPAHPSFNARMDEVNKLVQACQEKVHRCLVRCTRIKKMLGEAIRPIEPPTLAMEDPTAGHARTRDLKQTSRIFSNTLLHLSGPVDFQPDDNPVTELRSHSPQCPPKVQSTPLPDIPWAEFHHYLERAKSTKAGGCDGSNAHVIACTPEHIQRFLLVVCNCHLSSPLPPLWLKANIVLLFKKDDRELPTKYHPLRC